MNHIFCIHSSVVRHLGCFQLLVITNKALISIVEHMPPWPGVCVSFGYIPKSDIAGSSGRSISNFLRNLQIDFQSTYASLQSYHQWRSVPFSPHPHQHVLSPEVLILAILIGIRWNLRVILVCISLITKDFEHFFRSFSAILDFLVVNSRFSSMPHFWLGCLAFWWLTSWVLYIFWILVLSQMWGKWRFFSQSVGCWFVLLTMSFALQKLSSFMRFHYQVLFLENESLEFWSGDLPSDNEFKTCSHLLFY